ncbi:hypothetical protein R1sor_026714 [Riccia sorocarpa]|uniref:SWIM-type domain-containing protein n=1 Tax=Riccia sorocarpa TaxID=122646 RepID=A0ABD3GFV0_9MARC
MRASHKFKRNPDCRVRICRYGLPMRKKGVGKSCEWTPSEPSGSSQGLEPPHVLGVRSFNDFVTRRNTQAFPIVRPDRPDLNLEEQVFSQCTQRRKNYERRLVEMETGVSKGPDLVRYIHQIPVDRYVRFAIPLPRYGRTTSNAVECINGALKPIRDYAPCRILWQMWNYMLNLFYARREKARISSDELTEFAPKRMKEIVQNCGSFVAMSADENEALVQTDGGLKQWRLTKVPTRKCTCLEIQDCLWACIHFVAWQKRIMRIPNGGAARSVESEYSYPIHDDPFMNPTAVMTNVPQEDAVERGNPPVAQSSAPLGEQLSQAPPVARSRGTRCCGACKQLGHTRRTCPTLRQYMRTEVHEGLDVAADGEIVPELVFVVSCIDCYKSILINTHSMTFRSTLLPFFVNYDDLFVTSTHHMRLSD